jgi:uncharacterized membrane protein YgaE (UPF0421/DUF939 family)
MPIAECPLISPRLITGAQLSIRAAVGASVSLALASWLGLPYPLYAFVAAVIVTDLSPAQTRKLSWRRLVATLVGASSGALLSQLFTPDPLSIGLGVLLTMLLCVLVRMEEAARVGGYICGIVMLSYGAEPWSYAVNRVLETMLGIAVAWLISHVPKVLKVEEPSTPAA